MDMEMIIVMVVIVAVLYVFLFANKSSTRPASNKETKVTKDTKATKETKGTISSEIKVEDKNSVFEETGRESIIGTYFVPALSQEMTIRVLAFENEQPSTTLKGQIFTTNKIGKEDIVDVYNMGLALTELKLKEPVFEMLVTIDEYNAHADKIVQSMNRIAEIYSKRLNLTEPMIQRVVNYESTDKSYKYCVIAVK